MPNRVAKRECAVGAKLIGAQLAMATSSTPGRANTAGRSWVFQNCADLVSSYRLLCMGTSIASTPFDRKPGSSLSKATKLRTSKVAPVSRSEEHTSELQSLRHLVCRLLL